MDDDLNNLINDDNPIMGQNMILNNDNYNGISVINSMEINIRRITSASIDNSVKIFSIKKIPRSSTLKKFVKLGVVTLPNEATDTEVYNALHGLEDRDYAMAIFTFYKFILSFFSGIEYEVPLIKDGPKADFRYEYNGTYSYVDVTFQSGDLDNSRIQNKLEQYPLAKPAIWQINREIINDIIVDSFPITAGLILTRRITIQIEQELTKYLSPKNRMVNTIVSKLLKEDIGFETIFNEFHFDNNWGNEADLEDFMEDDNIDHEVGNILDAYVNCDAAINSFMGEVADVPTTIKNSFESFEKKINIEKVDWRDRVSIKRKINSKIMIGRRKEREVLMFHMSVMKNFFKFPIPKISIDISQEVINLTTGLFFDSDMYAGSCNSLKALAKSLFKDYVILSNDPEDYLGKINQRFRQKALEQNINRMLPSRMSHQAQKVAEIKMAKSFKLTEKAEMRELKKEIMGKYKININGRGYIKARMTSKLKSNMGIDVKSHIAVMEQCKNKKDWLKKNNSALAYEDAIKVISEREILDLGFFVDEDLKGTVFERYRNENIKNQIRGRVIIINRKLKSGIGFLVEEINRSKRLGNYIVYDKNLNNGSGEKRLELSFDAHEEVDKSVNDINDLVCSFSSEFNEFINDIDFEEFDWVDPLERNMFKETMEHMKEKITSKENAMLNFEFLVLSKICKNLRTRNDRSSIPNTSSFKVLEMFDNKLIIIMGDAPDDDTTGPIMFVYKNAYDKVWFLPKAINLNKDLMMTTPVRFNMGYVKGILSHWMGTLALRLGSSFFGEQNITVHPYFQILGSFYSREVRALLDYTNQIYSMMMSTMTLGKEEVKNKFDWIQNLQTAYALSRISKNAENEWRKIRSNMDSGKDSALSGVKDIITEHDFKNVQDFLTAMSTKNIVIRDDRIPKRTAEVEFTAQEAKFEREHDTVMYLGKGVWTFQRTNHYDFMEDTFKQEDGIPYAYNQSAILIGCKLLAKLSRFDDPQGVVKVDNISRGKNASLNFEVEKETEHDNLQYKLQTILEQKIKESNKVVVQEIVNLKRRGVKVEVFYNQNIVVDIVGDHNSPKLRRHQVYMRDYNECIRSKELDENIILLGLKYGISKEYMVQSGVNAQVIYQFEIECKNYVIDYMEANRDRISDVNYTNLKQEVAESDLYNDTICLLSWHKGFRKALLTAHIKFTEANLHKRVFFQQDKNPHVLNQLVERSVVNILPKKYSNIQEAGSQKNLIFEQEVKNLARFVGAGFDMTKFGDKFVLEALVALIKGLKYTKLIDDELATFMTMCVKSLIGRTLIVPRDVQTILEEYKAYKYLKNKKNLLEEESFRITKFELHNTEHQRKLLESILDQVEKSKDRHGKDAWEANKYNMFIIVERGFILGVLNMFGTLMSSITRIMEHQFYKYYGLTDGFFIGFAHSDDVLSFYGIEEVTEVVNKDIFKAFLKRLKKDCFDNSDGVVRWREDGSKVDPVCMNALCMFLCLITARLMGLKFGLVKSKMGLKEMLQVLYLDGSWSSAIAKFLYTTGKSIEEGDLNSSLLQAATGGIQNLRVQGALGCVIESVIVLNQLLIYFVSNVKPEKKIMMHNPLLGGIYFSHYPALVKRGFATYHGYMLKNALNDERYRDELNVCYLNAEIFDLDRSYNFKDDDDKITAINHFAKFEIKRPQGNIPMSRINPLMMEFIYNTNSKILEAITYNSKVKVEEFDEILIKFATELEKLKDMTVLEEEMLLNGANKEEIKESRSLRIGVFLNLQKSINISKILSLVDVQKRYSIIKAAIKKIKDTDESRTLRVLSSVLEWVMNIPFNDEIKEELLREGLINDFEFKTNNILWSDLMKAMKWLSTNKKVSDHLGFFLTAYEAEIQCVSTKYAPANYNIKREGSDYTWTVQRLNREKQIDTELLLTYFLMRDKDKEGKKSDYIKRIIKARINLLKSQNITIESRLETAYDELKAYGILNFRTAMANIKLIESNFAPIRLIEIIRLPAETPSQYMMFNYRTTVIPFEEVLNGFSSIEIQKQIKEIDREIDVLRFFILYSIDKNIKVFKNKTDEIIPISEYMLGYPDPTMSLSEAMKRTSIVTRANRKTAQCELVKMIINDSLKDYKIGLKIGKSKEKEGFINRIKVMTIISKTYNAKIKFHKRESNKYFATAYPDMSIKIIKKDAEMTPDSIMSNIYIWLRLVKYNGDILGALRTTGNKLESAKEKRVNLLNKKESKIIGRINELRKEILIKLDIENSLNTAYSLKIMKDAVSELKKIMYSLLYYNIYDSTEDISNTISGIFRSIPTVNEAFDIITKDITERISENRLNRYNIQYGNNTYHGNANNTWRITMVSIFTTSYNRVGIVDGSSITFDGSETKTFTVNKKTNDLFQPGDLRGRGLNLLPWEELTPKVYSTNMTGEIYTVDKKSRNSIFNRPCLSPVYQLGSFYASSINKKNYEVELEVTLLICIWCDLTGTNVEDISGNIETGELDKALKKSSYDWRTERAPLYAAIVSGLGENPLALLKELLNHKYTKKYKELKDTEGSLRSEIDGKEKERNKYTIIEREASRIIASQRNNIEALNENIDKLKTSRNKYRNTKVKKSEKEIKKNNIYKVTQKIKENKGAIAKASMMIKETEEKFNDAKTLAKIKNKEIRALEKILNEVLEEQEEEMEKGKETYLSKTKLGLLAEKLSYKIIRGNISETLSSIFRDANMGKELFEKTVLLSIIYNACPEEYNMLQTIMNMPEYCQVINSGKINKLCGRNTMSLLQSLIPKTIKYLLLYDQNKDLRNLSEEGVFADETFNDDVIPYGNIKEYIEKLKEEDYETDEEDDDQSSSQASSMKDFDETDLNLTDVNGIKDTMILDEDFFSMPIFNKEEVQNNNSIVINNDFTDMIKEAIFSNTLEGNELIDLLEETGNMRSIIKYRERAQRRLRNNNNNIEDDDDYQDDYIEDIEMGGYGSDDYEQGDVNDLDF